MLVGYYELSDFAGAIHWRDKGICQLCGIDCDLLERWFKHYEHYRWSYKQDVAMAAQKLWLEARSRLWDAGFNTDTVFWNADHIVPVCEGGATTFENGRLLCHPCHKRVTAELRQRRRKPRPQLELRV